jgi:hypothetical protein
LGTYKVLSDIFSLGKQGDTIDSNLLDGCNIQALVDGEHIVEVNTKTSKSLTSEVEK